MNAPGAAPVDPFAWLNSLVDFESAAGAVAAGDIAGLSVEPMAELVTLLGEPQHAYPVIHVTGTNGKGSTSALAAALLTETGLRVGVYSSPDQGRLADRMSIDGKAITDDEFAETLSSLAVIATLAERPPTKFEAITAAAFLWFANEAVDVAVVEVGLLGRFDATNVVDATVAVVTNVGRDHTDGREGWAQAVAWEKAGIIGPKSTLVMGPMDDDLAEIFTAENPAHVVRWGPQLSVANRRPAVGGQMLDITTTRGRYDDLFLPLFGEHQGRNAALALAAVEELTDRALSEDVIAAAWGPIVIPGRVEIISHQPLVVLDSAHNVDGAAALADTIATEFNVIGSRIVVIGHLTGRDAGAFLEHLEPMGIDAVIACTAPSPRAQQADTIAAAAERLGISAESVPSPLEAVRRALALAGEEDLVLVTGSISLMSPARAAWATFSPNE